MVHNSFIYTGSSPRVRGTAASARSLTSRYRFIPACAGNSRPARRVEAYNTVHPRVCGEQIADRPRLLQLDGSSPRVRGTVGTSGSDCRFLRFIPACAGNRPSAEAKVISASVHPRVCGEQAASLIAPMSDAGSSPRVRGTACGGAIEPLFFRFIPACAGNSSC